MNTASIEDMLDLAKRLGSEAAATSLAGFGHARAHRKADNSVVTETDHAIQARVLGAVAEAFPDHAVVAEETIAQPDAHPDAAASRYCWVIDPLDGTRNYACGFPCFATSIAVLDGGRPVVAVVSDHNLGLVYAAAHGLGATLNDQPIRVVEPPADEDYLVGIPSSKDAMTVRVLRSWVAMPGLILRNVGSTALHLAMVASGALAASFGKQAKIWDVAAGALLVTEAGGRITDPKGADCIPFALGGDSNADIPFLAAAPDLHQRLLQSIETVAGSPGAAV